MLDKCLRVCVFVRLRRPCSWRVLHARPEHGQQSVVLREPTGAPFPASCPVGRSTWCVCPPRWDVTTGSSPGPLIAVIDTGVHVTPDLAGRVELRERRRLGSAREPILLGHGTEVAGIVAASGADGSRLGRRVLELPHPVVAGLDADGYVSSENIAKAVDRAIARGAVVINLSLGRRSPYRCRSAPRSVAPLPPGSSLWPSAGNDGSLAPQVPGRLRRRARGRRGRAATATAR